MWPAVSWWHQGFPPELIVSLGQLRGEMKPSSEVDYCQIFSNSEKRICTSRIQEYRVSIPIPEGGWSISLARPPNVQLRFCHSWLMVVSSGLQRAWVALSFWLCCLCHMGPLSWGTPVCVCVLPHECPMSLVSCISSVYWSILGHPWEYYIECYLGQGETLDSVLHLATCFAARCGDFLLFIVRQC